MPEIAGRSTTDIKLHTGALRRSLLLFANTKKLRCAETAPQGAVKRFAGQTAKLYKIGERRQDQPVSRAVASQQAGTEKPPAGTSRQGRFNSGVST